MRSTLSILASGCAWLLCAPCFAENSPPLNEQVVKVYYNGFGAPPVVTPGRVIAAAERAFQRWAPCGVQFVFAGEIDALPGVYDGMNVIGWTQAKFVRPRSSVDLGAAVQPWAANGKTVEFDIALARWNVRTAPELEFMLVHELGHALGLGHSERESSVMFPVHAYTDLDPKPTRADIEACQRLYAQ